MAGPAICDCGAPMEPRMVAALCGPGLPGPVYELQCSSAEHQEQMREQNRLDQKARDEAAIAEAIESGLIDP